LNNEDTGGPRVGCHFEEIDLIRTLATAFVVVLHSASPILYQFGSVPTDVWSVHNVVDASVRLSVPLFFMASGFLLLSAPRNEERPLREVIRRMQRIGLPLVTWSLFYSATIAYVNGNPVNLTLIIDALGNQIYGAAVYHLWFLYELAVLYVLLPVLRALVSGNLQAGSYFVGVWLAFAFIKQMAGLTGSPNWPNNYIDLGNTGYFIAGYLVRTHLNTPGRLAAAAAVMGYLTSTLIIAYLTGHYSDAGGSFTERFYTYNSFLVIIQSLCGFIAFMKLADTIARVAPAIMAGARVFSRTSFGVYFVHVFFLGYVNYNVVGSSAKTSLQALIIIAATATYALMASWFLVAVLYLSRSTRWLVT